MDEKLGEEEYGIQNIQHDKGLRPLIHLITFSVDDLHEMPSIMGDPEGVGMGVGWGSGVRTVSGKSQVAICFL